MNEKEIVKEVENVGKGIEKVLNTSMLTDAERFHEVLVNNPGLIALIFLAIGFSLRELVIFSDIILIWVRIKLLGDRRRPVTGFTDEGGDKHEKRDKRRGDEGS